MLSTDLLPNEEYEEIVLTIGQSVKYISESGFERTGKLIAANPETGGLTVLTGETIQYPEYISVDDLIEA